MVANEADAPKQASKLASRDSEKSKLASIAREGFAAAIAPLEAKAGKPLNGPWRRKWEAKYHENPEGFCRVRDDVLARPWVRSLFAYFNAILDEGDHRQPTPSNGTRAAVCPSCDVRGGLHLAECPTLQPSDPRAENGGDLRGLGNGAQAKGPR